MKRAISIILFWQLLLMAVAEDGSRLWLRSSLPTDVVETPVLLFVPNDLSADATQTVQLAANELRNHWFEAPVKLRLTSDEGSLAKERDSDIYRNSDTDGNRTADGFRIEKGDTISVSAETANGLLYGAYFLLRAQGMGDGCLCQIMHTVTSMDQTPRSNIRALYVPEGMDDILKRGRLQDFARANASIGINGIILPPVESHQSISKTLALYGIQVYAADTMAEEALTDTLWLEDVPNWCGNHLAQFEWYKAGRMLWNPDLTLQQVAYEWLAQTFSDVPLFIRPAMEILFHLGEASTEECEHMAETWQQLQDYVDSRRHYEIELEIESMAEDIESMAEDEE